MPSIAPALSPEQINQLANRYSGITADSRRVKAGALFVALPRSFEGGQDGADYIDAAINNGASAILTASDIDVQSSATVSVIKSNEPRRDLALLLAARAGAMPQYLALVTGTNGKSSIVQMARELWAKAGDDSASVGTLGIVKEAAGKKTLTNLSHTTPDPEWLYPALAGLQQENIQHVAMEASSHGLHQHRLDGLAKNILSAAMAELSQDHLDYHRTLEHYHDSKLRLFGELLPVGGRAIFWQHSPVAEKISDICKQRGLKKIMMSRGKNPDATLCLLATTPTAAAGQKLEFLFMDKNYTATLPLAGHFQAENALTALLMVMKENTSSELEKFLPHLASLSPIRGRIEKIAEHRDAHFFVDYAHTDAALATILRTLRPFVRGKLIVVFGCGGNRDPFKRPKMGQVANDLADEVIITDDNPRKEKPEAIRKAILATCPKAIEAQNRKQAIALAVAMARAGDIILVAGKGHETGQIVGEEILPFDDGAVIREEIKNAMD